MCMETTEHFCLPFTQVSKAEGVTVLPTRSYERPPDVSLETCKSSIAKHWQESNAPDPLGPGTADEQWERFCCKLEKVLASVCFPGVSHLRSKRPKGSPAQFVSLGDERVSGAKCGTYKQRKLRHLLGRLREVSRQWLKGEVNDGLVKRIKATWPRDLSWPGWADAESTVEIALHNLLSDAEAHRQQKLRADLSAQGRAATRWIKETDSPPPTAVSNEAGNASQTLPEALDNLAAFWTGIWQRGTQPPELQSLRDQTAGGEAFPNDSWLPSAEQLAERAKQMRALSAGLDGWSGHELADLPHEVFECFRHLVASWSEKRSWPTRWTEIRQTHLSKVQQAAGAESVQAKDMRPISVLSIWYRLLSSTISRQTPVREWFSRAAPAECHGAIREKSAATALASIATDLSEGAAAIALDLAKCSE